MGARQARPLEPDPRPGRSRRRRAGGWRRAAVPGAAGRLPGGAL